MRPEHIHRRIDQQKSYVEYLLKAYDNLVEVGIEKVTKHRISPRLEAVKEQWSYFYNNHQAIKLSLIQVESSERKVLYNRSYFKNNVFEATHEVYLNNIEKMNSLLGDLPDESVQQSLPSTSTTRARPHPSRLPCFDLPKFDGTRSDWMSFKGLFTNIVINDDSISDAERLQYLKLCLIGSAAKLLRNVDVTNENFQKSWNSILSFYENRRLLVNTELHSLFSIKRLSQESAKDLERLYTSFTQALDSLESLKRPVREWDDILVFMIVQRLDSESVKAWEQHLGNSTEPPTWEKLDEFLRTRLRAIQAFENSQSGKLPGSDKSSARSHVTHTNSQEKEHGPCSLCSERHYLGRCPQYQTKTPSQRREIVASKGHCFNCLGLHRLTTCRSTIRCTKCGQRHHSSIHQATISSSKKSQSEKPTSTSQSLADVAVVNHVFHQSKNQALLPTALVRIINKHNESLLARALLDQGSEISLVCENLIQRLQLPRRSSTLSIFGVGTQKPCKTRGIVSLTIQPHFDSSTEISFKAYVLPKLTSTIPAKPQSQSLWPHLKNLTLADPDFTQPGSIDLIIGADIYGQLLNGSVVKGPPNAPVAQLTKLGWIISGSCDNLNSYQAQSYHCSIDQDLHSLLERFWHQEEVSGSLKQSLSAIDQQCEDHFAATHQRDSTGRYIVRLPLMNTKNQLGDSRRSALRMLNCIGKRFKTNNEYYQAYSSFLQEYKSLQHMIEVPDNEAEPEYVFYLPHHGVTRETSSTTKLRVVFNGSCKTDGGLSLNETLHTGAKLQVDLFDVLISFRTYKYIFSADIEKMYRQIQIHPDDRHFQRILWKMGDEVKKYRLTTVTYGLACALFLALRTILQLVKDEGESFPAAIDVLTHGRYVDDIFGGADSIEEAQQIALQTSQLCAAGGFPLRKWTSNHHQTLDLIPPEFQLTDPSVQLNQVNVQALGLSWNTSSDILNFKLTPALKTSVTKRAVLSKIAQFYDPLGLLSPIFIKHKIFMQELWAIKLQWDEKLPDSQSQTWDQLLLQLEGTNNLKIPRWLGTMTNTTIEVHGFCDSSQLAMAAAVYLRTTLLNNEVTVSLLCSKTKVAPLKRMTIPRLELSAAVMLTKLISHCISVLKLHQSPCYLWTDSSIVHTWLNDHPSKWKDFVHNRVCFIQETLPHAQWKHVPGIINPADCATRGLSAPELKNHSMWWSGPSWLTSHPSDWPQITPTTIDSPDLESRPASAQIHVISGVSSNDILHRYSTLTDLLRITVLCKRFIKLTQQQSDVSGRSPISSTELADAKVLWIKLVQQEHFSYDLHQLLTKRELPRSSPLIKLFPFIDQQGLLRVSGRLKNSSLEKNAMHPYILPSSSPLTTLIIRHAHHQTLHGSTQDTLNYIRNHYWILGGRIPVRSLILKCVICTRYRRFQAQLLMGQLPPSRVNPARAFRHSGVDYAGPFIIKTWKGRAARTYKAWIALFVCFATSAIHLEIVTDYTADAFIAAYKRFTSRRGVCATLTSDCGTNLKCAYRELRKLFAHTSTELHKLASLIANDGTTWTFNPPAAPHFGGKFEAGVKSMKHHLKRVVGDKNLTYEEMSTLLTQIEAILNSRPLEALTEDPEDLNVLTPGHFLIGQPLNLVPKPNLQCLPTNRLSRWQHLCQMTQRFWTKWSKEYLQKHLAMYKWNRPAPPILEGSLVLIIDERYPPAKWPLGRVIKLHPGEDQVTRVVTVKTSSTTLVRLVVKLCPLPISTST